MWDTHLNWETYYLQSIPDGLLYIGAVTDVFLSIEILDKPENNNHNNVTVIEPI